MAGSVIQRDFIKGDSRDLYGRLKEVEEKIAAIERRIANLARIESSGTSGATEQAWIAVADADGNTGYIRIYAAK